MNAVLERARCAASSSRWAWFSDDPEAQTFAKAQCALCTWRAICLEGALARGERHGIFGGLTATERAQLPRPARPKAHDRSCATSGRCHCRQGKAAHAAYMRAWRRTHVTRRGSVVRVRLIVLKVATGRGKHRAFPGQTALEIGGKR